MKLLIIGSEGFIGSHCVRYFKNKGWDIYGCDLLDYPQERYHYLKLSRLQPFFEEIFKATEYDYCINAAGNGSVPVSVAHPMTDFEANCFDVIRLLELIRARSPKCKYLHISSAAVYGNPTSLPVKEDSVLSPLSPYGWHKLIAEKICQEYTTLYNLNTAIIRPFSVYGPGLRKQLFWDLHQKSKSAEERVELLGSGIESRDFIFIDDLIKLIDVIMCNSPMEANIYNAASGKETTISAAAALFMQYYNPALKISFSHQNRTGDPINWVADTSLIKALGFNSRVSFEDGIKELTTWLKKQN